MTDFKSVQVELDRFDRFVTQYNSVINKYTSKYPELIREIAELRVNISSLSNVPSNVNPSENVLDNTADLHLLKTAWRKVAKLSHPDAGGDPLVFKYGNILYKSKDVHGLNQLLDSLERKDFSDYLTVIRQKLGSLYSSYKTKPGYSVIVADMQNNTEKASDLTQKMLINTIRYLKGAK